MFGSGLFTRGLALAACFWLALPAYAQDQNPDPDIGETVNQLFQPEKRPPTDELIGQLSVPPGFAVNVFARDLGHARMMAVGQDGTIYLTCPRQNQVKALRDRDGDGVAEDVSVALDGLEMVHGVFVRDRILYLAGNTQIWAAPLEEDGDPGQPVPLVVDLPQAGQHANRTLAVGPDDKLYLSIGSSCNACEEDDSRYATMQRMELTGTDMTTLASGLRNTVGFDWHPTTSEFWGLDNGSDGRGPDIPPEELNRLEEGKHYGWPFAYADRQVDPIMTDPKSGELTKEQFAAMTEPSVKTYQAHSAPISFRFYQGEAFPERYRFGAFATMRGSWNRFPAVGYKVVFLPFTDGAPGEFEDFVTGFLTEGGQAQFARLAGLTVAPDGSLLVSDDQYGVIYRVSWTGAPATPAPILPILQPPTPVVPAPVTPIIP